MKYLSRQEELVLLTVFRLQEEAYLVKIRTYLNKHTSRKWSISSVFVPLDRLEKTGYLDTKIGSPTAKRGGKAVKFYSLSEEGARALSEVKSVHDTMWSGISSIALDKK